MSKYYLEDTTHIGPLALAIKTFGDRILEIGCGWYSTPLVHALSNLAITLESDSEWYQEMRGAVTGQLYFCTDISDAARNLAAKQAFDVVFLDCYDGSDRVKCAKIFLDLDCCIVGHDTERGYWGPIMKAAKYQRHFKTQTPHTSWFSNIKDVGKP